MWGWQIKQCSMEDDKENNDCSRMTDSRNGCHSSLVFYGHKVIQSNFRACLLWFFMPTDHNHTQFFFEPKNTYIYIEPDKALFFKLTSCEIRNELIMDRFYSISVNSDDDSSQSYLRKKKHRKCIKDAISSHYSYS